MRSVCAMRGPLRWGDQMREHLEHFAVDVEARAVAGAVPADLRGVEAQETAEVRAAKRHGVQPAARAASASFSTELSSDSSAAYVNAGRRCRRSRRLPPQRALRRA